MGVVQLEIVVKYPLLSITYQVPKQTSSLRIYILQVVVFFCINFMQHHIRRVLKFIFTTHALSFKETSPMIPIMVKCANNKIKHINSTFNSCSLYKITLLKKRARKVDHHYQIVRENSYSYKWNHYVILNISSYVGNQFLIS